MRMRKIDASLCVTNARFVDGRFTSNSMIRTSGQIVTKRCCKLNYVRVTEVNFSLSRPYGKMEIFKCVCVCSWRSNLVFVRGAEVLRL